MGNRLLAGDKASKPVLARSAGPSIPCRIFVGCAGWSIPSPEKSHFSENGTHLERYASRFSAVEINSSFYRPHRNATYARWAASVPADFRFAVKVPKSITHIARLENTGDLLARFLDEVAGLQTKLGCLLVQLPPSLAFEPGIADRFLDALRAATRVSVALEARHASWFDARVDIVLRSHHIARVAADPPPVPAAAVPGGWLDLVYHRLHGSPRIYYSAYSEDFIRELGRAMTRESTDRKSIWCIFDNTALGAAMPNARALRRELNSVGS